jgi:hypothetical protein
MFRKTILSVTIMAALALAMAPSGAAQADAKSPEPEITRSAYRLDYTMTELDEGKKINSRQFSMNSRSGDSNEIKIGTRVPVESKQGEFQYLDVGMNIRCHLADQTDGAQPGSTVSLSVQADVSNFAIPEQQGQNMRPTIRQMRIEASTITPLGKPMVIGVVDDPNSKHQFQLEVTVTKLRS